MNTQEALKTLIEAVDRHLYAAGDKPRRETEARLQQAAVQGRSALQSGECWRDGSPPADGKMYEVLCPSVMKWTPYKAGAPGTLKRKGGRWQESNGYGGFDNTDSVPVFHRPVTPPKESDT